MNEAIWLEDRSNIELGFIVTGQSQRPGLPSTVDRTLTIPGRHGQYDMGADLDARHFVLSCAFTERDAPDLQQRVMTLARFLVDSYGRPRTLRLRFVERPGQYFVARYAGNFDVDRIIGTGIFTLPFTAFDPFALASQETIIEMTITKSPEDIQAVSKGNMRTQPVIVLTNTGNTTITHFTIVNEYRLEE